MPSYVANYPEVLFIIYRDHYPDTEETETEFGKTLIPRAQHTSEKINVIAIELATAISKYLKTSKHYHSLLQQFAENGELSSPYLFLYHSRSHLDDFQSSLSDHEKRQFHLFLDYVHLQYVEEDKIVDDLIERGKITPRYIMYLFRPGELIVEGKYRYMKGYISTSWLSLIPRIGRGKKKWSTNLRSIKAENWGFDGAFSVNQQRFNIQLS